MARKPGPRARRNACPNKSEHAEAPSDYLSWHEWAEKMSETHDQRICPGCGLWLIWKPKEEEDG